MAKFNPTEKDRAAFAEYAYQDVCRAINEHDMSPEKRRSFLNRIINFCNSEIARSLRQQIKEQENAH